MYLHLSAAYYYLGNRTKQIEALLSMRRLAMERLEASKVAHYQRALNEASFALGLLYYEGDEFYRAKEYLLLCLEGDFYGKVSALLLAYYYCATSQETINLRLKKTYKKAIKTENRVVFFQILLREV